MLISAAGGLGYVSVTDYGAIGDNSTDNTASINSALATGLPVYFPPGNFRTAGSHQINANGQVAFGAGPSVTTITCTTAANPIFTAGTLAGLNNIGVTDMSLARTVTATSGGDGVQFANVVSVSYVERLTITGQYRGLVLGPTDLSRASNINITGSQSHGLLMTNTSTNAALQWDLIDVLSQENVGDGFNVTVVSGPSACTLGTWRNVHSFGNSGHGASFAGLSSCPISGVRILDSFLGQDGNHEINIQNSYSGQHLILNTQLELAGTGTTGPTLGTAATNSGSGIFVDSTTNDILIADCKIVNNSNSGVNISAAECSIIGCRITQNGAGAHSGDQNGIWVQAGRALIAGCRSGNVTGGATNTVNGVLLVVDNSVIVGNDLTGNTTPVSGTIVNSTVFGNFPATQENFLPGQLANLSMAGFISESIAAIAAAGTTQGTATVLAKQINVVTSGTGGVELSGAAGNGPIVVVNTLGSAINVYPQTSAQIGGGAVNAAISLAGSETGIFYATSTTQWYANIPPAGGTGNVTGPGSSTSGDIATFGNTSGSLLADSGVAAANVVQGPSSASPGDIATFSGLTGKLIQDSGIALSTGVVLSISTIASLRLNTSLAGVVYVRGYSAGSDGGEGIFWYNSADTTTADNGGTIIVDGSSRRWYRAFIESHPINARWFGAKGDGSTDDTTAVQNACNYAFPKGYTVYVPAGTYKLTSQILVTLTSSTQTFAIRGESYNTSVLYWPSGNGFEVKFVGADNTASIRDLAFTTGTTNTGTALYLNQTASSISSPANTNPSDITNVMIRGNDGQAGTDYWSQGIQASVSNVNFANVFISGPGGAAYSTHGSGVVLGGTSTAVAVVFNFVNCVFNLLNAGLVYGTETQGVAVSNCNFTGCGIGISVPASESNLAQLTVSNSQFACVTGIDIESGIFNVMISTSLFLITSSANAINAAQVNQMAITGNSFAPTNTSTTSANGIVIGTCSNLGAVITGNTFWHIPGQAIILNTGSTGCTVMTNIYAANTGNVDNVTGSANVVGGVNVWTTP